MLRRFVNAAVALFVFTGLLVAGTYTGLITKIGKDEVTVKVRKKGEKKGEEKTFKVGSGVKITKKTKDAEDEIKTDDVTKLIDDSKVKGVFGTITTEGEGDAEKVTKIVIGGKGGKKKKKDS